MCFGSGYDPYALIVGGAGFAPALASLASLADPKPVGVLIAHLGDRIAADREVIEAEQRLRIAAEECHTEAVREYAQARRDIDALVEADGVKCDQLRTAKRIESLLIGELAKTKRSHRETTEAYLDLERESDRVWDEKIDLRTALMVASKEVARGRTRARLWALSACLAVALLIVMGVVQAVS